MIPKQMRTFQGWGWSSSVCYDMVGVGSGADMVNTDENEGSEYE